MGNSSGYNAYRDTAILTASQSTLILLLYDEAIRQIHAALAKIDDNGKVNITNLERYNAHVVKTQEIVSELMTSLDIEAGGEIAKNLLALYVYFNHELLEAGINTNKEKLAFVCDMIT
ncbi:MAG: flagellar export chaperone FliS, partial [Spirochaetaceae bacterium]|nr:flagellar export chaperone FliS [Spirochaetaceae bacterium]